MFKHNFMAYIDVNTDWNLCTFFLYRHGLLSAQRNFALPSFHFLKTCLAFKILFTTDENDFELFSKNALEKQREA